MLFGHAYKIKQCFFQILKSWVKTFKAITNVDIGSLSMNRSRILSV